MTQRMIQKGPLKRPLDPLERFGPWLVIIGAVVGLPVVLVLLVASGAVPDPGGAEIKGYTYTGTALGVVLVLLTAVAFAYSLRKRAWQEKMPGGGTMMMWLWLHMMFGGAVVLLTFFHAGTAVLSFELTTGKLLFLVFVGLLITGALWRVRYDTIPLHAAREIGNYAKDHSVERAQTRLLEIQKLAAGKSEAFRHLVDRCVELLPDEATFRAQLGAFDADEQAVLLKIHELALSRGRAVERARKQEIYTKRLQFLRLVHVPLAIAILPLVFLHVFGAHQVPGRLVPFGTMPLQSLTPIKPSKECKSCHAEIYEQWKHSMHAHAVLSPVTWVQNNRVIREELDDAEHPDPQLICVNCHSPIGTALSDLEPLLPWSRAGYEDDFLMEGVGCTTCHQFIGENNEPGEAAFTPWWGKENYDMSGNTYYAGIEDPVGNPYHKSATTKMWRKKPEEICEACHNVQIDRNGDGKIEKGIDLILQQTTQEYEDYRRDGGRSCFSCHMKNVKTRRAANSASIPLDQNWSAPERTVHDHSFVGVDYPLDVVAKEDPHEDDREELLQKSASIDARFEGADQIIVSIVNDQTGHKLPTGLAFARQMWFEVKAFDGANNLLKQSGVLDDNEDDLCDSDTMVGDVAALSKYVEGCDAPDPELVNFQQLLCSRVTLAEDANGEKLKDANDDFIAIPHRKGGESPIQTLKGGPLSRTRPADGQKLTQMTHGESRAFRYRVPPSTRRVEVRLLFRSFPPYFLRALGDDQPEEEPQLEPLIKNLQIVEMEETEITR